MKIIEQKLCEKSNIVQQKKKNVIELTKKYLGLLNLTERNLEKYRKDPLVNS